MQSNIGQLNSVHIRDLTHVTEVDFNVYGDEDLERTQTHFPMFQHMSQGVTVEEFELESLDITDVPDILNSKL